MADSVVEVIPEALWFYYTAGIGFMNYLHYTIYLDIQVISQQYDKN